MPKIVRQKSLNSFFPSEKTHKAKKARTIPESSSGSRFAPCPLCQQSFAWHKIEAHAAECDGTVPTRTTGNTRTKKKQPLPGLLVYPDFITEEEEQEILQALDNEPDNPWKTANFNGKHKGKRWGVHCNLRDRRVSAPERPMPSFYHRILQPKLAQLGLTPNEANAIDYRPGDFLTSHVDDRQLSKEPIANLSLAGACTMTFTNVTARNKPSLPDSYRMYLPRRCLQVLTGAARYDMAHGIEAADLHDHRRVSLTMRESPLTQPRK